MSSNETMLLLDIGSDGASASVVTFPIADVPRVEYFYHSELLPHKDQDAKRITDLSIKSVDSALTLVQKESPSKQFTKIQCFFSSPWYVSQTKVIRVAKSKSTLITKSVLSDIVEQEKRESIASTQKGVYAKRFNEELEVVECKVLGIRLNGYDTPDPYGKTATTIEMSLYVSIMSKDFLDQVKEVIRTHFPHLPLSVYTFPLIAFSIVRDIHPMASDFLLVDIDAEITDITVVKKGVILQSLSIPLGQNYFIDAVSAETKLPREAALSLLKLSAQGKGEKGSAEKMKQQISQSIFAWQAAFHKALGDLSEELFIPRKLFLTAGTDLEDFFGKMILEQNFSQFSLESNIFETTALDEKYLSDYYQHGSSVASSNTGILLESIFINKIR